MDIATILNRFGIPWPDADSNKARQARDAWTAIADAANDALGKSSTMVSELTASNSGPAMNAFTQYWSTVGGTPDECTSADAKAMLPILIQAADALASACNDFADAVDEAKRKLEEAAAALGAAVVSGVVATVFTAGLSNVVAGGAEAVAVSLGMDAVTVFGTSIDSILAAMGTGAISAGVAAVLDVGMNNAVATGLGDTPSDSDIAGDVGKDMIFGAVAGGVAKVAVGAAQTAAEATLNHLPDSVAALVPDLPTLINAIPGAIDTPTGQALTKLTTEHAEQSAAAQAQGTDAEPTSIQEALGEILDSKIEAAGESEGG